MTAPVPELIAELLAELDATEASFAQVTEGDVAGALAVLREARRRTAIARTASDLKQAGALIEHSLLVWLYGADYAVAAPRPGGPCQ